MICVVHRISRLGRLRRRHYLIAGTPSWTEEGHRFSWHMKLREKSGTVTFVVSKDGLAGIRPVWWGPAPWIVPLDTPLRS